MGSDSGWLSMEKIREEMEFLRLFRLLHNIIRGGVEQGLREMRVDLTSSQLDVLISIAHGCGRPVNQRDIEEQLRLSNPTVTGILKRMERKGFVSRTVGRQDRRYREVRLTEKCARLGDQLHPSARELLERMFRGFTPEEFDTLNRMLRRLLENCRCLGEETELPRAGEVPEASGVPVTVNG